GFSLIFIANEVSRRRRAIDEGTDALGCLSGSFGILESFQRCLLEFEMVLPQRCQGYIELVTCGEGSGGFRTARHCWDLPLEAANEVWRIGCSGPSISRSDEQSDFSMASMAKKHILVSFP